MASDHKRPIELWLKAYSRQRKQAVIDPVELHPVTRQLLQSEVRRCYPAQTERMPALLPGGRPWWPRLAWGTVIFACLIAALVLLYPPSSFKSSDSIVAFKTEDPQSPRNDQREFARASGPEVVPVKAIPSPALVAAAPVDVNESHDDLLAVNKEKSVSLTQASERKAQIPPSQARNNGTSLPVSSASTSPPTARRMDANLSLTARDTRAGIDSVASPLSPRAEALPAALTADTTPSQPALPQPDKAARYGITPTTHLRFSNSIAAASAGSKISAGQAQPVDYSVPRSAATASSRQPKRALKASPSASLGSRPPAIKVLDSFDWEQQGQRVQIIDADGSMYFGQLSIPVADPALDVATLPQPNGEESVRLSVDRKSSTAFGLTNGFADNIERSNYLALWSFAFSGTNLTLQQPVQLAGQLLVPMQAVVDRSLVQTAGWQPSGNTATNTTVRAFNALGLIATNQVLLQGRGMVGSNQSVFLRAISLPAQNP